jgi:hypothetical protein
MWELPHRVLGWLGWVAALGVYILLLRSTRLLDRLQRLERRQDALLTQWEERGEAIAKVLRAAHVLPPDRPPRTTPAENTWPGEERR